MKSLLVFCFVGLLVMSSCTQAYDEVFVSLENKAKVMGYYENASKLLDTEPLQAKISAKKALELSEHMYYTKGEADAHYMLGLAYDYLGEYGKAVDHHLNAIRYRESIDDEEGLLDSYNNLAILYQTIDLAEEAEQYYQIALGLAVELDNKEYQAKINHNIGYLFQKIKNYDKAQVYYTKSLDLYKAVGSKKYIGYLYNDLGLINELKPHADYNSVLAYYKESLKVNEQNSFVEGVGWSWGNIGRTYIKLDQPETALEYLIKAEVILQEKKDYPNLIFTLSAKAEAYQALNKLADAKEAIAEAEALEPQLAGVNKENLLEVHQLAQKIYEQASLPAQEKAYKDKETQLQKEIEFSKEAGRIEQYKGQADAFKAESDFKSMMVAYEEKLSNLLKIAIALIVVFLIIIAIQYRTTRKIMKDYRDFIVKRDSGLDIFN